MVVNSKGTWATSLIWNGCGHNKAVTHGCRQNVIVNTVRNSPHSVRGRVIFSQMSFCNSPNSVRGRVIFSKMSFCRPKEPLRPDRTSHVTHAAAVKQTRQLPAKNPRTAHTSRTLRFFPKENSHTLQSVTNRSASALPTTDRLLRWILGGTLTKAPLSFKLLTHCKRASAILYL